MIFDTRKFRPAQQGDLDGLCGVYVLVNFLSRRLQVEPDSDDAMDIFKEFLNSLHVRGRMTPTRIIDGFKWGQLQKVFNEFCTRRGLSFKAAALTAYSKRKQCGSVFEVITSLAEDEGAMININNGSHWVLAHSGSKRQFWIDDSQERRCKVIRQATAIKHEIKLKEGLVLINA